MYSQSASFVRGRCSPRVIGAPTHRYALSRERVAGRCHTMIFFMGVARGPRGEEDVNCHAYRSDGAVIIRGGWKQLKRAWFHSGCSGRFPVWPPFFFLHLFSNRYRYRWALIMVIFHPIFKNKPQNRIQRGRKVNRFSTTLILILGYVFSIG